MLNPLDLDVSDLDQPVWVRTPTKCEPILFFDGDRFLHHIQDEYETFDVLTYSLSRSEDAPLRHIDRLITNIPLVSRSGLRPKQVRVIINNHAKLYLCYAEDKALQVCYVGSQNLSHGTQINLMYRVDYIYNKTLADFFERLWKAAKAPKK